MRIAEEPQTPNGVTHWTTPDGISVARVHYCADPDKTSPEWKKDALIGYPGGETGTSWRKEMEIDFSIFGGKAVYPTFSRKRHVASEPLLPYVIEGIRKRDGLIVAGWDNTGLSPACVSTYVNSLGQWMVFKEFCGEDIGIEDFGDAVKLWWGQELPAKTRFRHIGDPAGRTRDSRKKSPAIYLAEHCGIFIEDGIQTFKIRRECVEGRLNKTVTGGEPAILIDPGCSTLVIGFEGGYRYGEIGTTGFYKTEPEKNFYSHCLVGETVVDTLFGKRRIKDVRIGDYVRTPMGFRMVTATMNSLVHETLKTYASDGSFFESTGDHPVFVGNSLVKADALQYSSVLVGIRTEQEKIWADWQNTRFKSLTESSFIGNLKDITKQTIKNTVDCICTVMFGNFLTAPFPAAMKFITKTPTNQIMPSPISNASMAVSMLRATLTSDWLKIRSLPCEVSLLLEKPLKSGTLRQRALLGILNTVKRVGQIVRLKSVSALFADKNMNQKPKRKAIAALIVLLKLAVCQASIMLFAGVRNAIWNFPLINTVQQQLVLSVARQEKLTEPKQVYDLTVEGNHCFYANGVLVGNCHDALQYPATILWGPKESYREDYGDENNSSRSSDGKSQIGGY